MQATAVKPPAAAAIVPVRTVSLYSCPGSRRWTWMSISPGATTSPEASKVSAPLGGLIAAVELRHPAVLDQQVERLVEVLARVDHPAAVDQQLRHARIVSSCDAGEQIEDGHAHRDAVGHLLQDHRVAAVRHLARDLDAAVHRAGVHDDHVVLRRREARGGEAEELEVLA